MQLFKKHRERNQLRISRNFFSFKRFGQHPSVRLFLKAKLQYTGFNITACTVKFGTRAASIF